MNGKSCNIDLPDLSEVEIISLPDAEEIEDYSDALVVANFYAARRFDEFMLISWYDRDRDFESPPHTTEKPGDGEKDGYIHYALSHGAKLMVDIESGRFVFFYTPVEW
ncbi:MAG: AF1514 family protein [Proteobacteria bacterium]|nr:AF1514 family protein [Pseudomonadota bacterium]MBU1739666.1 AF1514 family protein [Pseudomonadota bacterium]